MYAVAVVSHTATDRSNTYNVRNLRQFYMYCTVALPSILDIYILPILSPSPV